MLDLKLSYRASEEILELSLQGVELRSRQAIHDVFAQIRNYWARHCKGNKVYAVINYTNFKVIPELLDYYSEQVKRVVDDLAVVAVRYSAEVEVRAQLRVMAIKIHRPSNIYSSQQEALAVARGLRAKTVLLQTEP